MSERRVPRSDGRTLCVMDHVSLTRDPAGCACGVIAVVQDITHRRAAEDALRRLNEALESRVAQAVAEHPVVLFMKGTPQYPMCGYSSRAVQALMAAGAEHLRTINVLEDPEIRANLPRYSNWPTFPQLFLHGELIGGCDITLELHESGELARMVGETHRQ